MYGKLAQFPLFHTKDKIKPLVVELLTSKSRNYILQKLFLASIKKIYQRILKLCAMGHWILH